MVSVMEDGKDPNGCETREDAMHDINGFLHASYMLGVNPLPPLRKIFPLYEWKFEQIKDRDAVRERVTESDFIWMVDSLFVPDEKDVELVTATKLGRESPLSLIWADDEQPHTLEIIQWSGITSPNLVSY